MYYKDKVSTKDGRSYYFKVHYKDLQGTNQTYKSKKFKTKQEAIDAETEFRVKLGETKYSKSNVTFKEVFESYYVWLSKQIKPQSLRKIKPLFSHIEDISNKKVKSFNYQDLCKMVNNLDKEDLTANYKNKVIGLFKRLIKYSSKYNGTSEEILKFVENFSTINEDKKEMLFFTYDEYKRFESVIEEDDYKLFFQMLYYMGLRIGELQALKFKDIKNEELNINKTLDTKQAGIEYVISTPKTKNSIRILPLPKKLSKALKNRQLEAMKLKDYTDDWFIFGNSHPFKNTTITKRKNKYCKLSNNKQIRIHDFRHSCASYLLSNEHGNASIILVSKWLGHGDISITLNTYAHLYKNELLDVRDTIEKEI